MPFVASSLKLCLALLVICLATVQASSRDQAVLSASESDQASFGGKATKELVSKLHAAKVSTMEAVTAVCTDALKNRVLRKSYNLEKCGKAGRAYLFYANYLGLKPKAILTTKASITTELDAVLAKEVTTYNALRAWTSPAGKKVTNEALAMAGCKALADADGAAAGLYHRCLTGAAPVLVRNHDVGVDGDVATGTIDTKLIKYALQGKVLQMHSAIGVECEMSGVTVYKEGVSDTKYIPYDWHLLETDSTSLGIPTFMIALDHRNGQNIIEAKTGPLTPNTAGDAHVVNKALAMFKLFNDVAKAEYTAKKEKSHLDTLMAAFNGKGAVTADGRWALAPAPGGWNRIPYYDSEKAHDDGAKKIGVATANEVTVKWGASSLDPQVNVGLPVDLFYTVPADFMKLWDGNVLAKQRFSAIREAVKAHLTATQHSGDTLLKAMTASERGLFVLVVNMNYCLMLHSLSEQRPQPLEFLSGPTKYTLPADKHKWKRLSRGVSKNELHLMHKSRPSDLLSIMRQTRLDKGETKQSVDALYTAVEAAASSSDLVDKIVTTFGLELPNDGGRFAEVQIPPPPSAPSLGPGVKTPSQHAASIGFTGFPVMRAKFFQPAPTGAAIKAVETLAYNKELDTLKKNLQHRFTQCSPHQWSVTTNNKCQSPVGKPLPSFEIRFDKEWKPAAVFESRSGNVLHGLFGLRPGPTSAAALTALENLIKDE